MLTTSHAVTAKIEPRMFRLAGLVEKRSRIRPASVFIAAEQGIDVGTCRYAVVCDTHHTVCAAATREDARMLFRSLEFCKECMNTEVHN